MKIIFAYPIYLWILLLLPILAIAHLFVFRRKRPIAIKFSNFEALEKVANKSYISAKKGLITKRDLLLLLLRTGTYIFFILAISGVIIEYSGKISNFDFVLTIDSSSSMLADDFEPNRLEAAKQATLLFADTVAKQTNIGIVSFAGEVTINLNPTKSTRKIRDKIKEIEVAKIGGTNIGDALITSGNIFEGENQKVIILLTDGQFNIGTPPIEALDYLKSKKITVYTIGVATKEGGKLESGFVSKLDEETLKTVAEETNGKYYRAGSKDVLRNAFEEIASSTIKKTSTDLSWALLITGFILLIAEWFLASTKFRILP